jgi:GTPase
MFIDQATIHVKAGNGGNGIISFRHEKYIPKGGPDGGNGGKGGDIILRVDTQLTTLMDFRYKRNYAAENGDNGQAANRTGKSGQDTIIRVPAGTIIKDEETEEIIADLVQDNEEIILAQGGRGGKGNSEFATSINQAPRKATNGVPGESHTITLELKLLADVGLIGFPNAGKSTLISRISAARPKIADYPFTTLIPNLGIVRYGEYKSFVVADMPGLIEGAHTGKGLGIEFLRHIERTRVIVCLIESTSENIKGQYATLMHELKSFNESMAKKPQIIVISKMDIADDESLARLKKVKFPKRIPVYRISAVTGDGIKELTDEMWKQLYKKHLRKKSP